MSHSAVELPPGLTVFERGWLSSNNILLVDDDKTALVDSGYFSHREQTVALVQSALNGRPLDLLINTHLHSDHCGGNAGLQAQFPAMRTVVPPGQVDAVERWDEEALTFIPTGQTCERFAIDGVMLPNTVFRLGGRDWEVHAAPGHDPHSVVLFEPQSRCLLSADALWESGFGVVFPELEGLQAFGDVAATLDLVESLQPRIIVPGHGRVFADGAAALATARSRLANFVQNPEKHATHAAKVLIKFKLLDIQVVAHGVLLNWAQQTPYFQMLHRKYFADQSLTDWIDELITGLEKSRAISIESGLLTNA